ncbi:MAG: hypothetical protein CMJ78_22320 [Planctomycetaceae bacterium]|nr:hypothetical protein [Planctomycetaceae bacterium]
MTVEFGAHRSMLKDDLSMPQVHVQEQSDFIQGGGKLLELLDSYIREHCEMVIHLVGSRTGSSVKLDEIRWLLETHPDFLERFEFLKDDCEAWPVTLSYTQIEAWLALYHGKRLQIYFPEKSDPALLPADNPQRRHWQRLTDRGENHIRLLVV